MRHNKAKGVSPGTRAAKRTGASDASPARRSPATEAPRVQAYPSSGIPRFKRNVAGIRKSQGAPPSWAEANRSRTKGKPPATFYSVSMAQSRAERESRLNEPPFPPFGADDKHEHKKARHAAIQAARA